MWLALLLLLPLTLGWKVAVRSADIGVRSEQDIQREVAEFLAGQHFSVSAAEKIEEGKPSIRASAGLCRMLVAQSPAMGWDRDLIRRYTVPGDHVFVVFRGRTYAEQPTWRTVPDFLWARLWRELGFKAQASPVLAVVASPSCEAERLPWR
jgi:hypothetical protein